MKFHVLSLLVLCLLWGVHAYGQEDRGRISGVVTDTTDAAIPKANVQLTNASRRARASFMAGRASTGSPER